MAVAKCKTTTKSNPKSSFPTQRRTIGYYICDIMDNFYYRAYLGVFLGGMCLFSLFLFMCIKNVVAPKIVSIR